MSYLHKVSLVSFPLSLAFYFDAHLLYTSQVDTKAVVKRSSIDPKAAEAMAKISVATAEDGPLEGREDRGMRYYCCLCPSTVSFPDMLGVQKLAWGWACSLLLQETRKMRPSPWTKFCTQPRKGEQQLATH
jgi:hypothetical protein